MRNERIKPSCKDATELVAEAWGLLENGERAVTIPLLRKALGILEKQYPPKVAVSVTRPIVSRTDARRWWPNAAEVARALGVASRTAIVDAIERGGTCRGVYLRYEDTPEDECPPMQRQQKPVTINGVPYPSIRAAADALGPAHMTPKARFMWMSRQLSGSRIGAA